MCVFFIFYYSRCLEIIVLLFTLRLPYLLQSSPKKLIYQKSDGDMAGTETSQGDDPAFPLDTRPTVEHTRASAFEVYRKPHQGKFFFSFFFELIDWLIDFYYYYYFL